MGPLRTGERGEGGWRTGGRDWTTAEGAATDELASPHPRPPVSGSRTFLIQRGARDPSQIAFREPGLYQSPLDYLAGATRCWQPRDGRTCADSEILLEGGGEAEGRGWETRREEGGGIAIQSRPAGALFRLLVACSPRRAMNLFCFSLRPGACLSLSL
ncbi:hypothetical protein GQ53DRAFT_29367 [Thozetella sp. PMI_491]|nr:hypothetical protein GQ53DRAFT_29367 [Thozetella sp. PMI_491]